MLQAFVSRIIFSLYRKAFWFNLSEDLNQYHNLVKELSGTLNNTQRTNPVCFLLTTDIASWLRNVPHLADRISTPVVQTFTYSCSFISKRIVSTSLHHFYYKDD